MSFHWINQLKGLVLQQQDSYSVVPASDVWCVHLWWDVVGIQTMFLLLQWYHWSLKSSVCWPGQPWLKTSENWEEETNSVDPHSSQEKLVHAVSWNLPALQSPADTESDFLIVHTTQSLTVQLIEQTFLISTVKQQQRKKWMKLKLLN